MPSAIVASGFTDITAIAYSKARHVAVVSERSGRLTLLDLLRKEDGVYESRIVGEGYSSPTQLAIDDANGRIVIADADGLWSARAHLGEPEHSDCVRRRNPAKSARWARVAVRQPGSTCRPSWPARHASGALLARNAARLLGGGSFATTGRSHGCCDDPRRHVGAAAGQRRCGHGLPAGRLRAGDGAHRHPTTAALRRQTRNAQRRLGSPCRTQRTSGGRAAATARCAS